MFIEGFQRQPNVVQCEKPSWPVVALFVERFGHVVAIRGYHLIRQTVAWSAVNAFKV